MNIFGNPGVKIEKKVAKPVEKRVWKMIQKWWILHIELFADGGLEMTYWC
jgi:hypothetical protein